MKLSAQAKEMLTTKVICVLAALVLALALVPSLAFAKEDVLSSETSHEASEELSEEQAFTDDTISQGDKGDISVSTPTDTELSGGSAVSTGGSKATLGTTGAATPQTVTSLAVASPALVPSNTSLIVSENTTPLAASLLATGSVMPLTNGSVVPLAATEVTTEEAFRDAVATPLAEVVVASDITMTESFSIADGVIITGKTGSERVSLRNTAVNIVGSCTISNLELIQMPDGTNTKPLTLAASARLTLNNVATAYQATVGGSTRTVANMVVEVSGGASLTCENSRDTTVFSQVVLTGSQASRVTLDSKARVTSPINATVTTGSTIRFNGSNTTQVDSNGILTEVVLDSGSFDASFAAGLSNVDYLTLDAATLTVDLTSSLYQTTLEVLRLVNGSTLDLSGLPDTLKVSTLISYNDNGGADANTIMLNPDGQLRVDAMVVDEASSTQEPVQLIISGTPISGHQYLAVPAAIFSRFALNAADYTLNADGTVSSNATDPTTSNVYTVAQQFGTFTGSGTLTARIDADRNSFVALMLGDVEVDTSNYDVSAGSTVITLKESYLKTLAAGSHTFRALFENGRSEDITLTVSATSPQGQGEESQGEQGQGEESQGTGSGTKADADNSPKGDQKTDKDPTSSPEASDAQNTGDRVNIIPPAVLALISASVLGVVLYQRKKMSVGKHQAGKH